MMIEFAAHEGFIIGLLGVSLQRRKRMLFLQLRVHLFPELQQLVIVWLVD